MVSHLYPQEWRNAIGWEAVVKENFYIILFWKKSMGAHLLCVWQIKDCCESVYSNRLIICLVCFGKMMSWFRSSSCWDVQQLMSGFVSEEFVFTAHRIRFSFLNQHISVMNFFFFLQRWFCLLMTSLWHGIFSDSDSYVIYGSLKNICDEARFQVWNQCSSKLCWNLTSVPLSLIKVWHEEVFLTLFHLLI